MAKKQLVMRVGALGVMSGALALYAAQAGVLPGVDLGPDPGLSVAPITMSAAPAPPTALTPAAIAALPQQPDSGDVQVPDEFVETQVHDMPQQSGFTAAPVIPVALPAVATDMTANLVRPAAFSGVVDLPLPGISTPEAQTEQMLSPFGMPCAFEVNAQPTSAAMIALDIAAPCHPDATVTITHSGITVTEQTDAVGLLTLDLPALDAPAMVSVALEDGSDRDVVVDVPDLADYDRVALVWRGDLGVELHVMEDGAAWMSEGHVHPASPRTQAALDEGLGFMTLLGDSGLENPMLAQVYTMPRQDGPSDVALSVDAPVTVANCTQAANARVLHMGASRIELVPLSFTYPTCDAVGDTLVLQNVFRDLRLAGN